MGKIYLEGCSRHYTRIGFSRFCRDQVTLGNKNVEIWGAVPHMFIDHHGFGDTEKIRCQLDKYGLTCRTFTPKTYRYNLGSSDSLVRDWSLAYFKECIRAANVLGADKMLINLPPVIRDGDPEAAREVFIRNIKELADYAGNYKISLALGGSNIFAKDLPQFIEIMKKLDIPYIGSFLETETLLYSDYSIREWLENLKTTLIHIHFADAGDFGSCKVGEGRLPVKQWLMNIVESGYGGGFSSFFTGFSCEQSPFLVSSVHEKQLREFLKMEVFDA